MRAIRRSSASLLLVLLAAAGVSAQSAAGTAVEGQGGAPEALRRAERLAAAGQSAEATRAYREWLAGHQGSPEYVDVLLRAADAQETVQASLQLLEELSGPVARPADRTRLLAYQVSLLRLAGRLEEARLLAEELPQEPRYKLERAGIYLELGMLAEAEPILRELAGAAEGDGAAAATLMLAAVLRAGGRFEEAESLYLLLQKRYPDGPAAAAALLGRAELLLEASRNDEAAAAVQALAERFPGSPEALLGQSLLAGSDPGVEPAAVPWRLLPPAGSLAAAGQPAVEAAPASPAPAAGAAPIALPTGGEVAPASPAPAAQPAPSPGSAEGSAPAQTAPAAAPAAEPAALIQTGSFRDAENAQYMVRDLQAQGFQASVRPTEISGQRYYRVVVGPPAAGAAAQALLMRLREAGFEGVYLFAE